jgi:DNA repair protein RecN (Recombination protein N)
MLVELNIKNFAIIDSLKLEFNPGLVILTGETGAGKSIIMGALDMLLGQRVDMSTMRKGSEFASVEAIFKIPENIKFPIQVLLEKEELQDNSEYLTLTRELRKDKRNIARVNGHITNVSVLVQLGEYLVDIHGQSEHLSLMRVNQHLGLLDRFSGTGPVLNKYREIYQELTAVQGELSRLRSLDREAEQRRELLAYQVDEIEKAALEDGEEDPLTERRNRLVNAEKLADYSQKVLVLLDDAPGNQPTIRDLMGEMADALSDLSTTDSSLNDLNDQTQSINDELFDIGNKLRTYLDSLEFDPDELEKVQDRLELINSLKRKYGETIPDILAYQKKTIQELNEITGRSNRIEELEDQETSLLTHLAERGSLLSEQRKAGAEKLADELVSQLDDLKMTGARFEAAFLVTEDSSGVQLSNGNKISYYPDGLEKIEFLIETNPGEGLKPLVKTASGGETARLMLAIKNVLARADQVSTLVFDEIDQGIGGRIGAVVGEKLFRLTPEHQVICITHLPQLAGFGQQHYQVYKHIDQGRTTIKVREVSGEDRIKELATMLGGPTEKNLASARDLLALASSVS